MPPQNNLEESPVNGVVGFHKVHFLHESDDAKLTPSRHHLLGQHYTIYHLSLWDESRLKWAGQAIQDLTEAVSQYFGYNQVGRVGL